MPPLHRTALEPLLEGGLLPYSGPGRYINTIDRAPFPPPRAPGISRESVLHSSALSCEDRQRASAGTSITSITYQQESHLRTRGSWVRILPGAPVKTRGQRERTPFSFWPE